MNKKGFSLVELLVVVTIIAILSVTAYIALGGQTAKARNSTRMNDLSTVQTALEIYYLANNNQYPGTTAELVPGQMPEVPVDPGDGTAYEYAITLGSKSFQLGASLEDETGGLGHTAYIIGNATGNEIDGCSYDDGTGACDCGTVCNPVDDDDDCLPYCL